MTASDRRRRYSTATDSAGTSTGTWYIPQPRWTPTPYTLTPRREEKEAEPVSTLNLCKVCGADHENRPGPCIKCGADIWAEIEASGALQKSPCKSKCDSTSVVKGQFARRIRGGDESLCVGCRRRPAALRIYNEYLYREGRRPIT